MRRVGGFLRDPSAFGVVAEAAGTGRILGFNFLGERDPIRAVRQMTLMSIGEYREPRGSYVPSVLC